MKSRLSKANARKWPSTSWQVRNSGWKRARNNTVGNKSVQLGARFNPNEFCSFGTFQKQKFKYKPEYKSNEQPREQPIHGQQVNGWLHACNQFC